MEQYKILQGSPFCTSVAAPQLITFLHCSQNKKLRLFPTLVTTIATCPLQGQWFTLGSDPIYAFFAYAHTSCQAVMVGVKLHPVGNFGTRFITVHGVRRWMSSGAGRHAIWQRVANISEESAKISYNHGP